MIGTELYDNKVGFVAAFLQAMNPLMMGLVHGYIFSDHIDIAIIFWVEISCYLLIKGIKTGKTKYYVLTGIAQGLGYLSKSYLCMVSFGITIVIFILTRLGILKPYKENISAKKVIFQLALSILVALPWVVFCLVRYTKEFIQENHMVFAHLYTKVEVWSRPWDAHLFKYMPKHYHLYWYLIILASFFLMLGYAIHYRSMSDIFIVTWIAGVITPLSISVSKVPAGTDIATPALLICFAAVCFKIIRGKGSLPVVAYSALILSPFFLSQGRFHFIDAFRKIVEGYVANRNFIKIITPSLYNSSWIIYQLLCYLITFAVLFPLYWILRSQGKPIWYKGYMILLKVTTVIMLIVLLYPLYFKCIQITDKKTPSYDDKHYNRNDLDMSWFEDVGDYIKANLPANSAIILDSPVKFFNRHYLMFFADRSVYDLKPEDIEILAKTMIENGGVPYIVSVKGYSYPLIYRSPVKPNYCIYKLQN